MAGETTLTIIGNLTADPELRFTPSGAAVTNLTIASTPRTFDKTSGGWRDGATLFARVTVWREQAENTAETLRKGMRAVVTGRMTPDEWTDRQTGEKRTGWHIEADEVAPSLRYATATVKRNERSGNTSGHIDRSTGTTSADPWATDNAQHTNSYDEPPF